MSVTLHEALENGTSEDWTNPEKWIHYIHITIDNFHHANIIHNDIKGDNFVFGTTSENIELNQSYLTLSHSS